MEWIIELMPDKQPGFKCHSEGQPVMRRFSGVMPGCRSQQRNGAGQPANFRQAGGLFSGISLANGERVSIVDVVATGFSGSPLHAFLESLRISASYRGVEIGTWMVNGIERRSAGNPG